MSLGHGYDYSVPSLIPLDAVAESGAQFVGRYLDGGNGLSAAEAVEIHRRGLGIMPILEHGGGKADNRSQAEALARLADNLCDNLGVPLDVPIVHCDDFNDPVDHEPEFFRRVVAASRRPVMMYGSLRLARAVADMGVKYFWIVGTWSTSPPTPPFPPERGDGTLAFEPDGIHLVQLANTRRPMIPGVQEPDRQGRHLYDTDIILKPFPTWGRPVGDDVAAEDVFNFIFTDKPFGVTRFEVAFEAAFENAMHKFMTPAADLDGHVRSYLQWISAAAKDGVGRVDPAAIKAAIQEAIAALPAERRGSTDDVTDAVLKALTDHPLVPPESPLP